MSGGSTQRSGSERTALLVEPEQKNRERSDEPGRRGNREALEFLVRRGGICRRQAIETRETQRAADQVNRGDDPARLVKLDEHDAIDHERRRHAEGDDVGQRIELAAKRAIGPAQTRQPAIEQIENARSQDEPDGEVHIFRDHARAILAIEPSTIFSAAANPQKRFPAVMRFGRR